MMMRKPGRLAIIPEMFGMNRRYCHLTPPNCNSLTKHAAPININRSHRTSCACKVPMFSNGTNIDPTANILAPILLSDPLSDCPVFLRNFDESSILIKSSIDHDHDMIIMDHAADYENLSYR
jgi:hypothetical protein